MALSLGDILAFILLNSLALPLIDFLAHLLWNLAALLLGLLRALLGVGVKGNIVNAVTGSRTNIVKLVELLYLLGSAHVATLGLDVGSEPL